MPKLGKAFGRDSSDWRLTGSLVAYNLLSGKVGQRVVQVVQGVRLLRYEQY